MPGPLIVFLSRDGGKTATGAASAAASKLVSVPIVIFDDFGDALDSAKPGDHYLKGACQLGGRLLAAETRAALTPVS